MKLFDCKYLNLFLLVFFSTKILQNKITVLSLTLDLRSRSDTALE